MTKLIPVPLLLLVLCLFSFHVSAQDAVIIEDGKFVRGTIKGASLNEVQLLRDDQVVQKFKAADIKEFLWNGDIYVSKPLLVKNKVETRFLKVEETGVVNLYSLGSNSAKEGEEPQRRVQVRPSVGVGIGSGGFGGVGFGGGIMIGTGGGRKKQKKNQGIVYYIEKPGSGPIQEIPLSGTAGNKTEAVKSILLQKLSDDEDLVERLKTTEDFDAKNVQAFVKAYNAMHR
ncbi:hypothetical protein [Pedobacter sp.]|uniref:hypothetical protein n=1 Tax=Pedobacter sp. TaxID=1411316 RepID=UPI003D7FC377